MNGRHVVLLFSQFCHFALEIRDEWERERERRTEGVKRHCASYTNTLAVQTGLEQKNYLWMGKTPKVMLKWNPNEIEVFRGKFDWFSLHNPSRLALQGIRGANYIPFARLPPGTMNNLFCFLRFASTKTCCWCRSLCESSSRIPTELDFFGDEGSHMC